MMRRLWLMLGLLSLAIPAAAQTPILVTPNTNLVWEETSPVAGFTPVMAQALTFAPTINGTIRPALVGVTCVVATPVPPDQSAATCKAPAAQLGLGSIQLTLTAASGSLVSLPSLPLQFLTVVIPIPTTPRVQ